MKRILRALVLILLLAAVVAGGFWYYRNRSASSAAAAASTNFTQVVDVTRGNLSATISVVGELDAVESADLAFERMSDTAKLESLTVKAGNTVKAGQVLATIDPTPYQQVLDQAKSDLQAAEETLAELKTPTTALDIAKADLAIATAQYQGQEAQDTLYNLLHPDMDQLKADVANAQSALAQAQASVVAAKSDTATQDQLTKLRDTEAELTVEHGRLANETYSDAFYQDRRQTAYNKMMDAVDARVTAEVQPQASALEAQMQVRTAQQTLADAQKALADAQAGAKASADAALALAKAQLAVKDADVALATAKDARATLDEGTDAATLAAAQADVDKKRLAVADAEAALAGTKLTAPFDGTVLQTNVAVGDVVAANTAILTVANLNNLQVLASVDETTIRRVSAGQPAQISFDAVPGADAARSGGGCAVAGDAARRRNGIRGADLAGGGREAATAGGNDCQREDCVGAGGKCAAGAGDGAAEGERDVPGAGAEHDGSGGAAGGGAGRGRAERRELHPDRARAERR